MPPYSSQYSWNKDQNNRPTAQEDFYNTKSAKYIEDNE